jgi:hypothetical protein
MPYFHSFITIILLIIKLLNCENITSSRSQREVYFPVSFFSQSFFFKLNDNFENSLF